MNPIWGLDVDELYAQQREPLLLFFVRRTADAEIALDLWAETFALALERSKTYRGTTEGEAAAWLLGIARRQLAQFYRRGKIEQRAMRRLRLERPAVPSELLDEIERRAGLQELRGELATALAELSPGVRAAVRLRVVEEVGYPDLAARLGISEPAARARVSRGLAALADLLDMAIPTTEVFPS
jgi:RNA polymerase sigma-70 factor (ECF subfamily)